MAKTTTYSGFNKGTAEKLLLDAGAFFKNFDIEKDTVKQAKKEGKLLGATRGGGKFEAKPVIRSIEIDGVKGRAKGLQVIDAWEVVLGANILEVAEETLRASLTATHEPEDVGDYTKIKAKNYIEIEDYIENITFVGKISGQELPVIIQVYNALNIEGLSLTTQDKNEAVIALNFAGCYDPKDLDAPPFAIFYPKKKDSTADTGSGSGTTGG